MWYVKHMKLGTFPFQLLCAAEYGSEDTQTVHTLLFMQLMICLQALEQNQS